MKHAESIAAIRSEILEALGVGSIAPMHLSDKDAAAVLGVKATTLAVWRSTGRYNLRYFKIGRNVRYRVTDLAEFMYRSVSCHTA